MQSEEQHMWDDVQAFSSERDQTIRRIGISADDEEAWHFFHTSVTSRSSTRASFFHYDYRGYAPSEPPLWSDYDLSVGVCWTEYPDVSEQRDIDVLNEEDIMMDDWDVLREVQEDAEAQRRRKELGFFLADETEHGRATDGREIEVAMVYSEEGKDSPESASYRVRH